MKLVNVSDVCNEVFAGGDVPKDNWVKVPTSTHNIPIYSNGEANDGLYGYTDYYRVKEPSVTVSARGTIGHTVVRMEPFVPVVRLITLVPKTEVIDLKYLCYAIQNYKFDGTGTSIPQLTVPMLKQYTFKLVELSEQKRIVQVIDKIAALIENRKQQLQKLDELIKARFVEMFGDPMVNPKCWEVLKITDAVEVEPQNGMYKPQSEYVNDGQGIPILRIDGFYDGVVKDFSSLKRVNCTRGEREKYLLKENDIVINRVNSIEYLGKCAHITGMLEDTVYESNMMRMHFDKRFNPVYLTKLLCSKYIYLQIVEHAKLAVNQASINQKDVLDFNIYLPPLELQNQFAIFVEQINKSKLSVQKSLDKLEILKKALIQKYFG